MSYLTTYNMTLRGAKTREEVEQVMRWLDEHELIGYAFSPIVTSDGSEHWIESCDECTWYDWKDDISELAKAFPEYTFCLRGEGEEREDVWAAYFKGEDYEFCHMEYRMPEPERIKWN